VLALIPLFKNMIFGLFDRLEMTVEGTGLELARVKRSIEISGGKLWIESDGIGQGTAVCFTLPVPEENF
jgi:signal transduction histidine kinase